MTLNDPPVELPPISHPPSAIVAAPKALDEVNDIMAWLKEDLDESGHSAHQEQNEMTEKRTQLTLYEDSSDEEETSVLNKSRGRRDHFDGLDETLIPWKKLQKTIKKTIPKVYLGWNPSLSRTDISRNPHFTAPPNHLPTGPLPTMPTSIPFGFTPSKSMLHPHDGLKMALYYPASHTDMFASADQKCILQWRNGVKVNTFPLVGKANEEAPAASGMNKWIFIKKWRIIVVATAQLELKLLNSNFEHISSTLSSKPVLGLEFNEDTEELIAYGVSFIMIWNFTKTIEKGRSTFIFNTCRLLIEDLTAEEWVNSVVLSRVNNRLYASCDNYVHVYNYSTGKRVETMKNLHDLNITAMIYHEELKCLITASKDCTVKVWNYKGNLVHQLKEHIQPVTAIVLPMGQEYARCLLSCSLDGYIILWDIENASSICKFDTTQQCVGLGAMKRGLFYYYTKSGIFLLNLNKTWATFNFTRSNVHQLLRTTDYRGTGRIMSLAGDHSIRLISPVTGSTLITGFPLLRNAEAVYAVYDYYQERIYVLLRTGEIAVYSCTSNPMRILDEWNKGGKKLWHKLILVELDDPEKCTCIALCMPAESDPDQHVKSSQELRKMDTFLLAGTENGQVVIVKSDHHDLVIQAHTAGIASILCYNKERLLITHAKDNTIKLWRVQFTTSHPFLECSLLSQIIPPVKHLVKHIQFIPCKLGQGRLMISSQKNTLFLYNLDTNMCQFGPVKTHEHDDDHTRDISAVAGISSLSIFASSSEDGTVKIWDGIENSLLREIHFQEPVQSVEFLNQRGDLIVGLSHQIALVKMQDYLPFTLQRVAMELEFVDDPLELSIMFDATVDFWGIYRQMLTSGQAAPIWHVQDMVQQKGQDPFAILTDEEYLKRKTAINQRKMRRLFLKRERQAYEIAKYFEPVTVFTDHALQDQVLIKIQDHDAEEEFQDSARSSLVSTARNSVRFVDRRTWGSFSNRNNHSRALPGRKSIFLQVQEEDENESNNHVHLEPEFAAPRRHSIIMEKQVNVKPLKHEEEHKEPLHRRRFTLTEGKESGPGRAKFDDFKTIYYDLRGAQKDNGQGFMLQKAVGLKMSADQVKAKIDPAVRRPPKDDPRYGAGERNWRRVHRTLDLYGGMPNSSLARHVVAAKASSPRKSTVDRKLSPDEEHQALEDLWATVPDKLAIPTSKPSTASVSMAPLPKAVQDRINEIREKRLAAERAQTAASTRPPTDKNSRKSSLDMLSDVERMRLLLAKESQEKKSSASPKDSDGTKRPSSQTASKMMAIRKTTGAATIRENEVESKPETPMTATTESHSLTTATSASRATTSDSSSSYNTGDNSTDDESSESKLSSIASSRSDTPATADEYESDEESFHEEYNYLALSELRKKAGKKTIKVKKRHRKSPERTSRVSQTKAPFKPKLAKKAHDPMVATPSEYSESMTESQESLASTPELVPTKPVAKAKKVKKLETGKSMPTDFSQIKARYSVACAPKRPSLENAPVVFKVDCENEEYVRAEHQTWDLLKSLQLQQAYDTLDQSSWFPGLQGKQINLMNIIRVCLTVIRKGVWKDKLEAMNAILNLYKTFEKDFTDPLRMVVLPQLDATFDESYRVRYQICKNLAKYNMHHNDIIFCLICRLADDEETVRNMAMNALAVYGISSKYQLECMMKSLKMIPDDSKTFVSHLDILMARLRKQDTFGIDKAAQVENWVLQIDPECCGEQVERPATCYATLSFDIKHKTKKHKKRSKKAKVLLPSI